MRAGAFLIVLGALSAAQAYAASDEPICAARPGKSTPPCTVRAGHLQLETGLADWSLAKEPGARETLLVVGETALKYGLSDRSDIELDVTPWQRLRSRAGGLRDTRSGFGDLVLSYKHRLTPEGSALAVAALPSVKLPTAKRPLGNRKVEAALAVPVQYSIADSPVSIALTPELDWLADDDGHGRHAAMVQVASVGVQATPKLGVSAELWGQWNWDPAGTDKQHSADGSIAYLARDDLQLDAGANFGLSRNTPDIELYAGFAKRF